jgi:formamidase
VHTSPLDLPDYDEPLFPVIQTEIGNLGVAICYDWLFPEVIRQVALKGAEVLIRVSAYMDPWGTAQPMDWWTLINRTRAIENLAYVVGVNRAGNDPKYAYFGRSRIVDPHGKVVSEAGREETVISAEIDIGVVEAWRNDFPALSDIHEEYVPK